MCGLAVAGKGTQCALLTREYPACVRGVDGRDDAEPHTLLAPLSRDASGNSDAQTRPPFGVIHISAGALLRRAISHPESDGRHSRDAQRTVRMRA